MILSDGKRALPIYVSGTESLSIELRLDRKRFSRPLTHDLMDSVLAQLGARVVEARVDKFAGGLFHGTLVLQDEERRFQLDARPSDAIALALGSDAPIYVASVLLHDKGVDLKNFESAHPDAGKRAPARDERGEGVSL